MVKLPKSAKHTVETYRQSQGKKYQIKFFPMINGKKTEVLQSFFIDSRTAQEEGIIFGP
jgi:hypothetical protein